VTQRQSRASVNVNMRAFTSSTDHGRGQKRLQKSESINSGISRKIPNAEKQEEKQRAKMKKSLVGQNVHSSYNSQFDNDRWRKRPLFNRAGMSVKFETGNDAAALLIQEAQRRDPYQVDFLQCVEEVAYDVAMAIEEQPKLAWVFKQLMEPERLITFRVPWEDDNGNARINRGYRIQYSSTLGPYRGGLRFHPHISHGSIRMLGWEQTLKNSLTSWPIGGSKGGSDFDPENKSDGEIKRFCESFMKSVAPLVASKSDAFESDLNVGAREMRYLRDAYAQILMQNGVSDVTDESDYLFGSTEEFPEGTGFGCAYFAERAMNMHLNMEISGLRCLLSGAGMLARSTATKLLELGAVPVTLSDTTGFIHCESGFQIEDIDAIALLKEHRGSLHDFARNHIRDIKFFPVSEGGSVWGRIQGDIAFPCISQGELNVDDATALEQNNCQAVFECADRACTTNARIIFEDRGLLFGPSKAVNPGAIVASGYFLDVLSKEGRKATKDEMDQNLRTGMFEIHDNVSKAAEKYDMVGNLKAGANLASFLRIAEKEL